MRYRTIIIILSICLVITGGYSIFKIFEKEPVCENEIPNEEIKCENEISEAQIEALGKILFNKVNFAYGNSYPLFKSNLVKFSDLSVDESYSIAFSKVGGENTTVGTFDASKSDRLTGVSMLVEKQAFILTFKELFGSDKNIRFVDFNNTNLISYCSFESTNIRCSQLIGGGELGFSLVSLTYESTRTSEENLIVTARYLSSDGAAVYADPDKTIQIDDGTYINSLNNVTAEAMYEKYQEQAGKIEITFTKDIDNNYYWAESKYIATEEVE